MAEVRCGAGERRRARNPGADQRQTPQRVVVPADATEDFVVETALADEKVQVSDRRQADREEDLRSRQDAELHRSLRRRGHTRNCLANGFSATKDRGDGIRH